MHNIKREQRYGFATVFYGECNHCHKENGVFTGKSNRERGQGEAGIGEFNVNTKFAFGE